ncbi:MAG: hypothetical protein U0414_21605 [Polyangiaceae bacterium]
MGKSISVGAALLASLAFVPALEANADPLPPSTPHPALVVGVVDDVAATALLATEIVAGASSSSDYEPSPLLFAGLTLAIEGVITTVHGATDHRALRNPAAAAAGHALTAAGAATAVTGVSFIVSGSLDSGDGGLVATAIGVPLALGSLLLLGPGIPLMYYGELDASPARPAAKARPDLAPRVSFAAGPGRFSLVGTF